MPDFPDTSNPSTPPQGSELVESPLKSLEQGKYLRSTRRTKREIQLSKIINTLNDNFHHIKNEYGACFFVEKATNRISFMDDEKLFNFLKSLAYQYDGTDASYSVIRSAIAIIKGEGRFFVAGKALFIRVIRNNTGIALHVNDNYFLKVGPHEVVSENAPEACFFKSDSFKPIDHNLKSAQDIQGLFSATNLPENADLLIIAWLVNILLPDTKFAALELIGEPQSGKTTAQKALRSLIDPSLRDFLPVPSNIKELKPLMLDGYIFSMDSVEALNPEVQKALADLLSGIEFDRASPARQENCIFHVKRPVIFNSIDTVVTESALANSTITVELDSLPCPRGRKTTYKTTASQLSDAFTGLIHLTSSVLANLNSSRLKRSVHPSLHDYCKVGVLVAETLNRSSEAFWEQYEDNKKARIESQLEEFPVGHAIRRWAKENADQKLTLSVQEWLELLEGHKPPRTHDSDWPHNAKKMGAALKRVAPLLRDLGIPCITRGKRGSNYQWSIGPSQDSETAKEDITDIDLYSGLS